MMMENNKVHTSQSPARGSKVLVYLLSLILLVPVPLYGGGPNGPSKRFKIHIVREGENLHLIAARYYNNARLWRLIYDVNEDTIKDPNLIHPGERLIIPELEN